MTDLQLVGSSVSPYTRKVRALLRYRRIPYQFVRAGGGSLKHFRLHRCH